MFANIWHHESYKDVRTRERIAEMELKKDQNMTVPGALVCVCGCNKIVIKTAQVRAGDEGTTVFAKCTSCNRQWKEG